MHRILRAGLCFSLALAASTAAAADLKGHLTLVSPSGDSSLLDLSDTVVFFRPDTAVKVKPLGGDITMTMQGKSFAPHVLTVTQGSTVRFPNGDPILHNVFSTSEHNDFDMGLYGHGGGKSKTFEHAGLVRVYCNVHHEMFAYILVLDTPYFTAVQNDGEFEIRNLPAVPGTITIYNPRSAPWHQHVDSPAMPPMNMQLTMVQRAGAPAHFNKLGKPYSNTPSPGY